MQILNRKLRGHIINEAVRMKAGGWDAEHAIHTLLEQHGVKFHYIDEGISDRALHSLVKAVRESRCPSKTAAIVYKFTWNSGNEQRTVYGLKTDGEAMEQARRIYKEVRSPHILRCKKQAAPDARAAWIYIGQVPSADECSDGDYREDFGADM